MKHRGQSTELKVIARGPFKVYYEGSAKVVSADNRVGPFDILPGHADFFSLLTPCDVTIDTNKDPVNFQANNGIITVRADEVMLFINI
jgi:F0F1-type ATP synthase epsilon subunit